MKKKKNKKESELLKKIKKFFNSPVPIIIALIIICSFLLLYITRMNKNNLILIGSLKDSNININRIHCFTNSDMDYFYATPASYYGDEEIYSYQIGYFYKDSKDNLKEFISKSGKFDNAQSLYIVVNEISAFEIGEANNSRYLFKDDVLKNIKNLYFVIRASSKKDSKVADINLEYKIDSLKLTK